MKKKKKSEAIIDFGLGTIVWAKDLIEDNLGQRFSIAYGIVVEIKKNENKFRCVWTDGNYNNSWFTYSETNPGLKVIKKK